jgi:hypothetical protein
MTDTHEPHAGEKSPALAANPCIDDASGSRAALTASVAPDFASSPDKDNLKKEIFGFSHAIALPTLPHIPSMTAPVAIRPPRVAKTPR